MQNNRTLNKRVCSRKGLVPTALTTIDIPGPQHELGSPERRAMAGHELLSTALKVLPIGCRFALEPLLFKLPCLGTTGG